MTLALDISHFTESTSGPLTTRQLEDAYNLGVRAFRPSIADQAIAVRQIDAIVDSHIGFDIWTYRYYYFGRMAQQADTDKGFIQRVRDLKYNIQLHSLDIEDTNPGFTTQQRIQETAALTTKFENFCPTDMYTANWYWRQYMGNTEEFRNYPLWFADWDETPDLVINPTFGGFNNPHMKQFKGDTNFAGIWCDVNYYEAAVTPPPPQSDIQIIKISLDQTYRFEIV